MNYSLNYRKILMSASVIAFVSALVFGGTQAFFSDEETSSGNLFAAGAIDLLVDSEAHYAGLVCNEEGVWVYDNDDEVTTRPDLHGTSCDGTWTESDLGPQHRFFDYGDLKPGDHGENTISLHVIDNDAYACAVIDNMEDNDNGLTEPEEESGDNTGGAGEGELSQELRFFAWSDFGGDAGESDRGNNIWDPGEPVLFSNEEGPASDVIDGVVYPLYTPDMNDGVVLQGTTTEYIGLYWCYGDITVDEGNNTLECDGAGASNMTQTDSMSADITFYVEQARNNEDFECPALEDFESEPEVVGAQELAGFSAPESEQCDLFVDGEGAGDNEYVTIQEAVDAASAEDTICVDTGTYTEDVTVDEDVTILGLNDPKGGDKATVDGRMDIDVAGVTVSGLEMTNPDAGYSVVIGGVGSTEISGNSFVDIGTSLSEGSAQAIYFVDGPTDVSGLVIENNMIDGVGNTSLVPNGGSSAKGIFVGDSTADSDISGLVIENNTIMNVFASTAEFDDGGRGAYGILINIGSNGTGETLSPTITQNTIATIEGLWVHAIGLEGPTPGGSVTHNDISDLTEHKGGTDGFGVFFEANPGGSTTVVNMNNFASSMPFGVGLHPSNQPAVTVDAENNWWGDADPTDDFFEGPGTIDYLPFEASAYPTS